MFDDCLIMAGGGGTRLWPASNSRLPKQFLPAAENQSFFFMALKRALSVTGKNGRVIIITGKSHIPFVLTDASKFSAAEKKRMLIIGEPAAKNTAAAVACAAAYSLLNGDARNMLVITSDHIIKPLKTFKADAAIAARAAKEGKLVIFGIKPARAETGYGYIETGKKQKNIYEVSAFHEKPDLQTAKKYAANKRFFWNSGMFAFNTSFISDEVRLLSPDVFRRFEKLKAPKHSDFTVSNGVSILKSWHGLETAYSKTINISFDCAIVEKCGKTAMVQSNFDWIDIGNWEEYVKNPGKTSSQVFSISSESCYVDSDIPVALAGVEDLIVVIRGGKNGKRACALITRKGQTQKVRDVVEQIRKSGKTELL
jgi:mannose-1-phosphate guanylyltransferase/mannose-1-phosphate guanylyltransferase/mannose-6-phosphate isomerase